MKKCLTSIALLLIIVSPAFAEDDCVKQADDAKLEYLRRDSFIKSCMLDRARSLCEERSKTAANGDPLEYEEKTRYVNMCTSKEMTDRSDQATPQEDEKNEKPASKER